MSERAIDPSCPHCNQQSFALEHPLITTDNFYVVCDVHPLTEGHILIIPKWHLSCAGEFDDELFTEFEGLYRQFTTFIKGTYGNVSTFEHGKIGQTIPHAHVQILPFAGTPHAIVPEGAGRLQKLHDLADVRVAYKNQGQYLFFSIGDSMWVVDIRLGVPRFFRDRFAKALGHAERGDWKKMQQNTHLMNSARTEIEALKKKWDRYNMKR